MWLGKPNQRLSLYLGLLPLSYLENQKTSSIIRRNKISLTRRNEFSITADPPRTHLITSPKNTTLKNAL